MVIKLSFCPDFEHKVSRFGQDFEVDAEGNFVQVATEFVILVVAPVEALEDVVDSAVAGGLDAEGNFVQVAAEFVFSVVAPVEALEDVDLVAPEQVEAVDVEHNAAVVAVADDELPAEADDVEQSHVAVVVVEHNVAVVEDVDHNVVAVVVAAECIGVAVVEAGPVAAVAAEKVRIII